MTIELLVIFVESVLSDGVLALWPRIFKNRYCVYIMIFVCLFLQICAIEDYRFNLFR